jgi:hypothetical protein
MLQKGQLTPLQHQQAMAGVLSGAKGLIDSALTGHDKTDPMQKTVFETRARMLRDDTTSAREELREVQKARMDATMTVPASTEPDPATGKVFPTKEAELLARIKKNSADELDLLSKAGGSAGAPQTQTVPPLVQVSLQSANPADQAPSTPQGHGYIAAPIPGANSTENHIMGLINQQVGPGVVGLRGQYQNITRMGGSKVTPDIAQQLLQEAGGDKDRARQLAQQRGYSF